jgi:hypothetical protein
MELPGQSDGADAARVDAEAVAQLARIARLPLTPERSAEQVERLEGFLAFADEWEDLGLAFSFEDGRFSYAPSIAQFRPEWDLPTKLNKQRVVSAWETGSGEERKP